MYELMKDPQTLPFLQDQQVHLPKLKHQIDRRMLKIIALIQKKGKKDHVRKNNSNKRVLNKHVQTDSLNVLQATPYRLSLDNNVLSPSAKFNPNVQNIATSHEKSEKKYKKTKNNENSVKKIVDRPLRMHRPQTLSYQESDFLKQESAMLQSNGFTFRGENVSVNQTSIDFGQLNQTQGHHISKDQFPMKLSCIQINSKSKDGKPRNSHYIDINIKDIARSEISRMSFNTQMSQRSGSNIHCSQKRFLPSKTKRKMTDVSLPESEIHRIIVSNECMQKMKSESQLLVGRRRKEFWDSKIRLNMLKKIEEKYARQIYDC